MIETNRTDNLQGQLELADIGLAASGGNAGAASDAPTGYDEAGHLINPASASVEPGERLNALAVEIRTIETQVRTIAISGALEIGKRLLEARQLCPKGRWLEWISVNLDYSERRAQDLMRLYEQYGRGTIPEAVESLDFSKAVALLSAPPEAREELAEKAVAEDLSVRQLQEEIRRLKEEAASQQMVIEGLRIDNDSVRDDGQKLEDENDRLTEELKAARQAIEVEQQKARLADARAIAAEESAKAANESAKAANESVISMRKVSSKAMDDAAASAQRASDAVERANQTAKDLSTARARIAELEAREPEVRTVEKASEATLREIEQLKRDLARAEAKAAALEAEKATGEKPAKAEEAGPVDRFRWFYGNQMQPAFKTALSLLKEVAEVDGNAANMFATAVVKGCKMLMAQLGTEE